VKKLILFQNVSVDILNFEWLSGSDFVGDEIDKGVGIGAPGNVAKTENG